MSETRRGDSPGTFRVLVRLNPREFNFMEEFKDQVDESLIRIKRAFDSQDRDELIQELGTLNVIYFKIGQRYVFTYHAGKVR